MYFGRRAIVQFSTSLVLDDRSRVLEYCHFKFAGAKAQEVVIKFHFARGLESRGQLRKIKPRRLCWGNLHGIASTQNGRKITGRSFKRFKSTKRTGDTARRGWSGLIFRHSFRQTSNCISDRCKLRFGLSIVQRLRNLNSRDNADYRMMTPAVSHVARWQRAAPLQNTAQASGFDAAG